MHVLREILRQKLVLGLTNRRVASAVGVSAGKVHSVYSDARSLGIDAAAAETMTDDELTARLYPKTLPSCIRPQPDCARLHLDLRRRALTLALLHVEYLAEQPEGLSVGGGHEERFAQLQEPRARRGTHGTAGE
jgi:hypothetical protein